MPKQTPSTIPNDENVGPADRLPAGVILAGGKSSRFGRNKALALYRDQPIIVRVATVLGEIFRETLLVTNSPTEYAFLGWPMTGDLVSEAGPLAGIQAALSRIKADRAFIVACDMPRLDPLVIRGLCQYPGDWDVVLPRSANGPEPLHAVYHRRILPTVNTALAQGQGRLGRLLEQLQTRAVPVDALGLAPETELSFTNINYLQDLEELP